MNNQNDVSRGMRGDAVSGCPMRVMSARETFA